MKQMGTQTYRMSLTGVVNSDSFSNHDSIDTETYIITEGDRTLPTRLPQLNFNGNFDGPAPEVAKQPVKAIDTSFHQRAKAATAWIYDGVSDLMESSKYSFADRLKKGIANASKFTPYITSVQAKDRSGTVDLTLRLWKVDTLAAAEILHKKYPNDKIAVLNMANPNMPGGGLRQGSLAQEEVLCMRTTLYRTLSRSFYPLSIPQVIYSPDVLVARSFDETWEGAPTDDADKWFLDVISAAAVSHPTLARDPVSGIEKYANNTDRETMRNGVESILKAAVKMNVKRLVLGAWGCGIFRNPINEVASVMRETILGTGSNLPAHNWAELGLEEVIIAIYDQDHQNGPPVWNGFLHHFRGGNFGAPNFAPLETTEMVHILRWPETELAPLSTDKSHSAPAHNPPRPNPDGLDSLFEDSMENLDLTGVLSVDPDHQTDGPATKTGITQTASTQQAALNLIQILGQVQPQTPAATVGTGTAATEEGLAEAKTDQPVARDEDLISGENKQDNSRGTRSYEPDSDGLLDYEAYEE